MSSGKPKLVDNQVLTLEESKDLIDAHLLSLLHDRATQAAQISPFYASLWQKIITLYAAGGKRLRPYLTLLAYQAFGGQHLDRVIPAAAAQELLHQAMLIHDDVIDRDLVRYGVRNVTGQYDDEYDPLLKEVGERRHFAESAAILAGDLLISEAHAHVATSPIEPSQVAAAQHTLTAAIFHVVGGELLDTEASFRPNGAIDALTVATQKTASYSFVGPLTMGAILAGANDDQLSALKELGNSVGIAFQLRDDLIGIFGDETVTGKSTDGDLREGKRTLLIDEFHKRSDDAQKQEFNRHFGKADATEEEIQSLRDLLEVTGTRAAVESYIENYELQTAEQLDHLEISAQYREAFVAIIHACLQRNK